MVGVGELVPREDFPFQGGEERLRGGIVETRPDPALRLTDLRRRASSARELIVLFDGRASPSESPRASVALYDNG